MAKRRVMFTFPAKLIAKPIIYKLAKEFNVITNIRRADVAEDQGWVVLELDGKADDIQRGIDWVTAEGVRVDPIEGDIIEG